MGLKYCRRRLIAPSLVAACLIAVSGANAQQRGQQDQQQQSPDRPSTLFVSVRLPDGSPYDLPAIVNLYNFSGTPVGIGTFRAGIAEFDHLGPGSYTVEVVAVGYQKLTEAVQIITGGERQQVEVTLVAEASAANPAPPGPPILAPAAEKELSKALEDIRANKPEDAKKHLEKASRAAPANPDVNYLWGMYYAQVKDVTKAKEFWEKAIQIYPRHVFSLAALAQLALQDSNGPAAVDLLVRVTDLVPSSWRYQERLAEAYLLVGNYEEVQKHAERAIELGKERAAEAQFVLAQALLRTNNSQRALKALDVYIASQPSGARAAEARQMLGTLRPVAQPPDSASAPVSVTAAVPRKSLTTSITEELVPPPKWMPPDVDESMPPVESVAGCPLEKVRDEAGKRVGEFVDAVNRIAATESLENEVIDRAGLPMRRVSRNYSYVASVQQIRPGMYIMEEYRNGAMDLDLFPERVATLGLTALVMAFHSVYRDDYDVACEGLSRWHGGLAWQVHFRQRADKPPRLRSYRVNSLSFPVALRGRAWIAADTFQIVSLETDIVSPIPQIQLKAEHISVEYAPVKFTSHQTQLWLPESAEIFFDYGHRRMHRRHYFRDYMLFAVDEKQQISFPKTEPDTESPSGPSRK
jgi:tetratricopeptide (TPR) repeat protein